MCVTIRAAAQPRLLQTADQRPLRLRPDGPSEEPLRIHGLTVERYREIYSSALTPSVLAELSSSKKPDYVCQVLELKRRLWTKLSRPQLVEKVGVDGHVEVTEVLDLT